MGSKERPRTGFFNVLSARKVRRESSKKERGGGGGRGRRETSSPPSPISSFGSQPIFRAAKTPKIPFLGLSLLPNPIETLVRMIPAHIRSSPLTDRLEKVTGEKKEDRRKR